VFAARPDRVAALLELGTSGVGTSPVDGGTVTPGAGDESPPDVPGYQITGKLGEGGMGTVWRARQLSTRRDVALKLVGKGGLGSHRDRLRFDREVQLAAKLEHPSIARVYDSGMSRGLYYYAMELVEPATHLDRYVADRGLGPKQILSLVREVCLAVQYAHQRGVIHRDLKPSNVVVDGTGRPRVLDFGLAKALEESEPGQTLTLEGQWGGTPAFMAPEQAAGHAETLDTRTDVYGLGATLYLLLTGRHAHDLSGPRYEVMRRIARDEVVAPLLANPALDSELNSLLLKALAQDPERRYASAAELARDIENYVKGDPLAARPPTALYAVRKRLRKHWAPVAVSLGVAGLLLGLGLWSYARESKQRRIAEREAREAQFERQTALQARKEAEVHLAYGRIAEGDALVAADEIGRAKERYDEAWDVLERNGVSSFPARLAMWDAHRKSPPPLLEMTGHSGQVNCLAYLPGGRALVSGSDDGTARIWDAVTGRCTRVLENVGRVQRLSLSPDGKTVALAGMGRGLTLWEVRTGNSSGELTGFRGHAISVAFSPDGRHLFVGTTDGEQNAYLFAAGSGKLIRAFIGHASPVRDVAFTPDGRVAITAGGRGPQDYSDFRADATVRAWDVLDGRQLWVMSEEGNGRFVADVAVSPDGSIVAAASPASTRLVEAGSGQPRGKFAPTSRVHGVAFSPDGALLATANGTGKVEIHWAESGEALEGDHPRTVFYGGERAVTFSPDARFVAAAGDYRILVWPLFEQEVYRDFAYAPSNVKTNGQEEVTNVAFSPDGRLALSDNRDFRGVRLWDVATGWELKRVAAGPESPVGHNVLAAFIPRTDHILLVEPNGAVGVWNLGMDTRLRVLEPWEGRKAAAVAVSPDGARAMVRFTGTGELQLYDLPTGKLLRALKFEGAMGINRMVFSPDSRLAAACARGAGLRIWDVATGREVHAFSSSAVNKIAFSPDGGLLACGGEKFHVFDTRTWQSVPATPWASRLLAVSFLSDRGHAVVGGEYTPEVSYGFLSLATGGAREVGPGVSVQDFAWHDGSMRLLAGHASPWGNMRLLELSYPATLRQRRAARDRATALLAADPKNGEGLRRLGEWYAFRGVWDYAAELLEGARRAGVAVPPLLLARCYWMDAKMGQALEELRRALAGTNDPVEAAYLRICIGAIEEQRFEYSDRYFKHPYFMLSRRLSRQGRWEDALRLFDGELALLGGDAGEIAYMKVVVLNLIAHDLVDDPRVAKELYLQVLSFIQKHPQSPPIGYRRTYNNLARAAYRLGEFPESVEWSERALEAGAASGFDDVRLLHGDALWKVHRREEAVAAWRQGLADSATVAVSNQRIVGLLNERLRAVEDGEEPPLYAVLATALPPELPE
jgi:WD40 repeat protein/tetratricopeptide (TPR) repeat protein